MRNDGTEAQDLFVAAMQARKFWVHRFRDQKDVRGLNRGKKLTMFPCPADFIVGGREQLFLAECKSTYDKTRFSYSDIRPAQRAAAGFANSCSFPYYFFILAMTTGQWYVLSASDFAADLKAGIKSRSFQELEPCSLMLWSI